MRSGGDVFSGNSAFWAKIYQDNYTPLCSRARRQLTKGNSTEAEDAVSEAFIRVMRYAQNPQGIRNPLPYLWTVIRRVWAAQHAHPSTAMTDRLDDLDIESLESLQYTRVEPEVLEVLEKEDFIRELKLRLGPLTLEEVNLLELRLENYSWEEIASRLGEDANCSRFRWYKFIARQRYRLAREKAKSQASGRS